jgi:hypothetical protein
MYTFKIFIFFFLNKIKFQLNGKYKKFLNNFKENLVFKKKEDFLNILLMLRFLFLKELIFIVL